MMLIDGRYFTTDSWTTALPPSDTSTGVAMARSAANVA